MFKGEKEIKRQESLKKIISDYEAERKKKQGDKESAIKRRNNRERLKIIFKKTAFYGFAALTFAFSLVALIKAEVFKKPEYWVEGARSATDRGIEGCIANLWKIRKAVDLYYAVYGKFPSTVSELYTGVFLRQRLVCPASGKEYLLKETGGQKAFLCPQPQGHNVSEIRVGLESGPVVVRRE